MLYIGLQEEQPLLLTLSLLFMTPGLSLTPNDGNYTAAVLGVEFRGQQSGVMAANAVIDMNSVVCDSVSNLIL